MSQRQSESRMNEAEYVDLAAYGHELVRYARAHLREALGGDKAERPNGAWCKQPGATFVTLRWKHGGDLQGCIGTLEADRAILDDVAYNAVAAGTRDPRTQPCTLADVDKLHVELSILSPLEPIGSEADIRVGTDGIVLFHHGRRATFLPVMWERLPTKDMFMGELRRKAGLPRDFQSSDIKLLRYTASKFEDLAP
jgi:AmmeMemoRadiSam system protein A